MDYSTYSWDTYNYGHFQHAVLSTPSACNLRGAAKVDCARSSRAVRNATPEHPSLSNGFDRGPKAAIRGGDSPGDRVFSSETSAQALEMKDGTEKH